MTDRHVEPTLGERAKRLNQEIGRGVQPFVKLKQAVASHELDKAEDLATHVQRLGKEFLSAVKQDTDSFDYQVQGRTTTRVPRAVRRLLRGVPYSRPNGPYTNGVADLAEVVFLSPPRRTRRDIVQAHADVAAGRSVGEARGRDVVPVLPGAGTLQRPEHRPEAGVLDP